MGNNAFDEVKTLLADQGQLTPEAEPVVEPVVEEVVEDEPVVIEPVETEDPIEPLPLAAETEEAAEGDDFTPQQLADQIGWSAQDIYEGMLVPMGEGEDPVKLNMLKDDYQNTLRERNELQTKFDEQTEALKNAGVVNHEEQNISHEMISAFSDMDNIQKQFQQVNWAELEQQSPGEAALLSQKYKDAFAAAQGKLGQAKQNIEDNRQQNLAQAAVKLMEVIPEWKVDTNRHADQGEIRTLMLAEGYSNQMITSIADPIALKLLRELVGYRKQNLAAKESIKKVRKAPKVLSSTGRRKAPDKTQNAEKLKQIAQNAKPSSKRKAELDAVRALIASRA